MVFPLENLSDLPAAAEKLMKFAGDQKIFLFNGDMGAGKTTFIKSICKYAGIDENVTSPTFSIVNEYRNGETRIYHFDFYRLKKQEEALDMGYEEYFYSGNYCFIEWPEKIESLLPQHYIRIDIQVYPDGKRSLTFTKI